MAQPPTKPTHEKADHRIEEEALKVARSIQAPGQTKEQTRLIAKGIEKGIALYKQQQNAKLRERDKARKKMLKERAERSDAQAGESDGFDSTDLHVKWTLLLVGCLFAVAALAHVARFALGASLALGSLQIGPMWSLPGALASGGLAVWLWILGRRFG